MQLAYFFFFNTLHYSSLLRCMKDLPRNFHELGTLSQKFCKSKRTIGATTPTQKNLE